MGGGVALSRTSEEKIKPITAEIRKMICSSRDSWGTGKRVSDDRVSGSNE